MILTASYFSQLEEFAITTLICLNLSDGVYKLVRLLREFIPDGKLTIVFFIILIVNYFYDRIYIYFRYAVLP